MDRSAVITGGGGSGIDMSILHESDRYELVRDIGSGNFGVAKLMRDKLTDELVAVKYIERGDKARFFFQQLISGVSYCHAMQVCHRDLKLENTLLDGSPAPRLKICDFGYSKSSVLHSQPKSTVGTPAYIAPEVLLKKEYDGKIADVWSCGVTLYVMLVGAYPFEDPEEPKNFRKTIHRILNVQYSIPDYVHISPECRHLISRIFVADPSKRITIPEIRNHEWFLKNLPADLMDENNISQYEEPDQPMQSIEEIMQIITEATIPAAGAQSLDQYLTGGLDIDDDMEEDLETDPDLDIDSSGEILWFYRALEYCGSQKRALLVYTIMIMRNTTSPPITSCPALHCERLQPPTKLIRRNTQKFSLHDIVVKHAPAWFYTVRGAWSYSVPVSMNAQRLSRHG
ncbi:hypothetical protein ACFE04_021686 [Oxalis oulophora]